MATHLPKDFGTDDVATQPQTAKHSQENNTNVTQLSSNIRSFYSCLLKDIETQKFAVKEKSKDQSDLTVN